jgi:hypothetical protein
MEDEGWRSPDRLAGTLALPSPSNEMVQNSAAKCPGREMVLFTGYYRLLKDITGY